MDSDSYFKVEGCRKVIISEFSGIISELPCSPDNSFAVAFGRIKEALELCQVCNLFVYDANDKSKKTPIEALYLGTSQYCHQDQSQFNYWLFAHNGDICVGTNWTDDKGYADGISSMDVYSISSNSIESYFLRNIMAKFFHEMAKDDCEE